MIDFVRGGPDADELGAALEAELPLRVSSLGLDGADRNVQLSAMSALV